MRYLGLCIATFLLCCYQLNGQKADEDRSFATYKKAVEERFTNTPVKGQHKRARRALHHWESHLDENGRLFNYVQANMAALEQLYIDTFPALIQGDWQQIGPVNSAGSDFNEEGLGRVNHIAFASATTWYAGTAGGGLWRTDLAGLYPGAGPFPWYPLTDSLPSLAISGIAVRPDNVDDVYILTGDGESRTYVTRGTQPGIGILHSTDGGMSWDTTAMQYPDTVLHAGYKLVMYPGSPDTMYAACSDGLWRTTDGWTTLSQPTVLAQPVTAFCYDIEFKPGDPQTVYAATRGALLRSLDGGVSFLDITPNLVQTNITPISSMRRMAIAVSPDDAEILYVIIARADGGLMSFQLSSDGGNTFIETTNNSFNILAGNDPTTQSGGQGNYDLSLWADPGNSGTILVGGVNIWKNVGFGALPTWFEVMHWTNEPPQHTHADIHAIETNPFSDDIVVGSDGGLYVSADGGITWSNRGRGLGITQFYHMDVYSEFLGLPFLLGGAQDNGTSVGVGFDDPTFSMIGGGDGFRCYRGNVDGEAIRYRSTQNGKLYKQTFISGFGIWDESHITPDSELDGSDNGQGGWDTPFTPNPNNFNDLLAGYDDLYFSNDCGDDWVLMDYPSNVNLDGSELISEIAWSKSNSNVVYFFVNDMTQKLLIKCEALYVGVITGTLENAVCSIARLDTNSMMPSVNPSSPTGSRSNSLSDIAIDRTDDRKVWISFPGYSDSMKVFVNQDMANDSPWVNMSYNLPNVPVHCIEWDVDGLFAGTDIGAFFLPHGDSVWVYFSKGLPTVAVSEIEIDETILGKTIFASTWGRGIWWSTPPAPMRRTRWYVDSNAVAGLNDGSSWPNAFTGLQTALDTVLIGDSIWVAAGYLLSSVRYWI